MSVDNESVEHEGEAEDRREAPGRRMAFDGLVEVGGALGPAFEAQGVDLSQDGMLLRTAYLPSVGQPLTCRFDAGGREVLASGEVVWRHEEGRGGEFAIRFGELDADSREALSRIVDPEPVCAPRDPGARVRLHIEGLGSPMRARVKGSGTSELTVGSELGFLQVGKELELEDATTGGKRPARIDRVTVEIDPESKIPQLVVTLRYDDGPVANGAAQAPAAKADGTPEPSVIDGGSEDAEGIAQMKSAFARGAAKVTPAMTKLARRAIVTLGLVLAKMRKGQGVQPLRRTTAPPPGGVLHASGRRVVRSDASIEVGVAPVGLLRGKRGIALVAAVACAVALVVFALRKPGAQASASTPDTAPPPSSAPPTMPAATMPATEPMLAAQPPAAQTSEIELAPGLAAEEGGHKKPVHVAPFGNGPVAHGNLLHIKMDGAIEKIEGASTPTGFTVVIPNRRSLEAAAPLAARDGRIASMRVTNEAHGAELAVTFKDGVPNYQVRAKGDTLEIVLAVAGRVIENNDAPHAIPKPVASKSKRPKH